MPAAKGSRSARNAETRKKKARRTIPRPKQTRSQGNTSGARTALKKQAGLRRARAASSEA